MLSLRFTSVKIGPADEKRPARLNRQIWQHFVTTVRPFENIAVVYDGKAMAFSPRKFPADQGQWEINLPESDGSSSRGNRFAIRMSFIRPINLSALRAFISGGRVAAAVEEADVMSAIQALNVVIQHGPMLSNPSRGPSFFLRGDTPQSALGIEMWRGYFTSLRPGLGGAFLNLDITAQPFFKPGNLPEVLLELIQLDVKRVTLQDLGRIPGPAGIKLSRMLKGLRVTRTVRDQDGRFPKRKVKELVKTSAVRSIFQLGDGTTTNVADYFRSQLGTVLRHPEWPCVRISRVGLWPIEVCMIDPGQKYGKKLNAAQIQEMLKFTTIKPQQRLAMVQRAIQNIQPSNAEAFEQWSLRVNTTPIELTARQLTPPAITYGNNRVVNPQDGQWNLKGQRFNAPASFDRWAVFVFASSSFFPLPAVQQSLTGLVQQLQALGVRVGTAKPLIFYQPHGLSPDRVDVFIRQSVRGGGAGSQGPPELIVCYLDAKPSPYYAAIKRFSDLKNGPGVPSQCMNIQKARGQGSQYYANISLKINAKLGGVNSVASLGPAIDKPTIIFGADVSHPAPGSLAPSIVGVVASIDKTMTRYTSRIAVQSNRVEVIQDLASLVHDLLGQFKEVVKVKPERIIFFRDGVSEGQFPHVLDREVNAIRLACQKIDTSFKPKITYIVAGKRHKISLFPASPQASDRNGNVKAGTVVDTGVVSPFNFDFYLQSHGSLLGTSRSSHYTILVDDSMFSADALQALCNNITYNMPRCTRSVSYATPAYLADILCGRGALLLGADADDSATTISGHSDQEAARQLSNYRSRLQAIHPNHATNLFFV
ncbi:hypothetical protein JCM11641_002771 [Rhodosporidiobolus odoratus]